MANEYYWNQSKWEINQNGEGTRIHPLMALAIAPLLGGLFVVFMPFIGLYLFAKYIIGNVERALRSLFHASIAPVAVPGEVHLTGAKSEGVSESNAAEDTLSKLSKEIDELRK